MPWVATDLFFLGNYLYIFARDGPGGLRRRTTGSIPSSLIQIISSGLLLKSAERLCPPQDVKCIILLWKSIPAHLPRL
jgi:hypothetical protein